MSYPRNNEMCKECKRDKRITVSEEADAPITICIGCREVPKEIKK